MSRLPVLILLGAIWTPQAFSHRLDAALTDRAREGEPGAAVCVAVDGNVVYSKARGLANLDRGVPLTPATPVYVASLAKAFTAVAILQLVEQKNLTLDDRVLTVAPDLPSYLARVTVRHLLTHTSGVPEIPEAFGGRPGVTNADVLQRAFFTPLGMTSTFVHSAATHDRMRATGYRKEGGVWVEDDYDAHTVGPGGVYSSADDMCRWGTALDQGKLLKRMTRVAAFTPHVHSGASPTPMGLGFQVEDIGRGPLQGEWYAAMFGDRDGFRAVDMKLKGRGFRYVQLSNSSRQLEPMHVPNLYFGPVP